jgi:endonuclease YncB( thermonuclease family)
MPAGTDLDPNDGKSPHEQVQGLIRREIARHQPIEGALQPLEILAAASVRVVEDDGAARYEVVDENGRARTRHDGGESRGLTIAELIAELRTKHPTLFRLEPHDAAGVAAESDKPDASPRRAPRDWLILASKAHRNPAGEGGGRFRRLRQRCAGMLDAFAARARPAGCRLAAPMRGLGRTLSSRPLRALTARLRSSAPSTHPLYAFAGLAGALALVIVGLLGAWIVTRRVADGARNPGAGPPAAAAQTKPARTPEASTAAANSSPDAPPPGKPVALVGVPEVIDTATLRIEGKLVRLTGVEWARGAQSADLARYLGGRPVTCRPKGANDVYRCLVDGRDLSEVVLYNGGGRATSDAEPELLAAETYAKAEKIGVWRKPTSGAPQVAN